ncbi:MAG: methyltransferase domain-containing protein [Candidatus Brocadiales bacterium]|nr:methyltransferase domain-containing protein [Candidatus Brocadiales bacterium]
MRNYENIDKYLNELEEEIYPAPSDEGHTAWAKDVIDKFLPGDVTTVLDIGCGEGFCKPLFPDGVAYVGITLGKEEYAVAMAKSRNVRMMDMNFLDFDDKSFDLLFARHALEHSFSPLLSLMEWRRVSNRYLLLVLPAPDYWTYAGRNHFYVLNHSQWWNLFEQTNWKVIQEEIFDTRNQLFLDHYLPDEKNRSKVKYPHAPVPVEYRWLLEKK